jgi:primosomal replication protein N
VNRLVLAATLVERGAVRYTPAGLPALDILLKHESEVSEDGLPRKVSLEIKAVAIGAIARPAGAMALGSMATFAGFLGVAHHCARPRLVRPELFVLQILRRSHYAPATW